MNITTPTTPISSQPPLTIKGRSRCTPSYLVRGSWREIVVFGILLFAFCIFVPRANAGIIIRPPSYLGLQQGLVGCWTFDGSYSKAPDCSGNNNTGTLTNGPVKTTGQVGQALSFDGSNDFVALQTAASLNITSDISTSAWIKTSSSSRNQIIIGGYQNGGAFPGYGFAVGVIFGACASGTLDFWDGTAWRCGNATVN